VGQVSDLRSSTPGRIRRRYGGESLDLQGNAFERGEDLGVTLLHFRAQRPERQRHELICNFLLLSFNIAPAL
jgi:hypothetical protein